MDTAQILSKSFADLSYSDYRVDMPNYNLSVVLNSLEASFFSQLSGLEVAENGGLRSYNQSGTAFSYNKAMAVAETELVASEEVYFLTQVILNTLNTEPSQFHDMFDIPGLEAQRWDTLANIAQYLIAQGWLEARAVEERLLVKLTIPGKIYLRSNNAWS